MALPPVDEGHVLPNSLDDVVALIQEFYRPGSQAPHWIDRQLQTLQRSSEGWQMADALLAHADPNVKFYGAQTFTVKINSDTVGLEDEEILSLESRLIHWIVTLLAQQPLVPPFVMKKLCSTLATLYTLGRGLEPKGCIKKLLCSCIRGDTVSDAELEMFTTPNLMGFLDARQWELLLWLTEELASEGGKKSTGYPPEVISKCRAMMEANILDAITLITAAISPNTGSEHGESDTERCDLAMSCFRAWVFCAQLTFTRESENVQLLRGLLKRVLRWFSHGPTEETTKEFTELLSNYPSFFQGAHLSVIFSHITGSWGESRISEVLEGNPEADAFVRLLVALGDTTTTQLAEMNANADCNRFLEMMHMLAQMPGVPGIDEEYRVEILEFWNNFVEYVVDYAPLEDESLPKEWLEGAKAQIARVLEEMWAKLRTPDPESLSQIDSDSLQAFKDFRSEVADLLQSSYPLFGPEMVVKYVQLCVDAVQAQLWLEVEQSLYCLNALGVIQEQMDESFADTVLTKLFSSPLYSLLASPEAGIPNWPRRTALVVLGEYAGYFSRNITQLPAAFGFLLSSLDSPQFAHQAARAISSVCDACRKNLATELDGLFTQYERFSASPTANDFTKQKVIGAISFVIQALPSDDAIAAALDRLLSFIDKDVAATIELMSRGDVEESQRKSIEALNCLEGIGKALQAPQETPIDLDDNQSQPDYWLNGPGNAIQQRILRTVYSILEVLGSVGDIISAACDVFKAGFVESQPGPFVFAPQATVEFFTKTNIHTPQLVTVLNMTCSFLRHHTPKNTVDITPQASIMLQHLVGFIAALNSNPSEEPEISQCMVDVFTRYIPRYTDVLFSIQPSESLGAIFRFVIACAEASEPLTKRAACRFWGIILTTQPSDAVSETLLPQVWAHFGPSLANAFIGQIAGRCLRTDLEYFAEPMRHLLTKDPRAKQWYEQAVNQSPRLQSLGEQERRVFLGKLSV